MTYGLWLSAAGMQGNQYRQNLMANNMANVDTAGFKRDLAVIRERSVESQAAPDGARGANLLDRLSGGSFVAPTYHSFDEGPLVQTGNPLDVAVKGDAFLQVRIGNEVQYTRDGRFTVNENNELVMVANGGRAKVLGENGLPIVLAPNAGKTEIAADGTIRQDNVAVDKVGLVEFADRNTLRKVGGNLFTATAGAGQPAQSSSLMSGVVEGSTVDPVAGLAEMIEVSRAYQLNAQMITLQDMTVGQAVSRVGRIG